MNNTFLVLFLSAIAGFADVIGGGLTVVRRRDSDRSMGMVMALGAGFLLGATLLDRLPDSMGDLPNTAPLLMVCGYLAVFVSSQLFSFEMGSHVHHAETVSEIAHHHAVSQSSSIIALAGLLIHTFFDGVVIAGAFDMSKASGILMFAAISLHKLPEGFGMASIFLASGRDRRKALLSSAALGASTVTGAAVTLWIGAVDLNIVKVIMALATGTFIYITTSELIPALRGFRERRIAAAAAAGVFAFYGSLLFVKHVGLS